MRIAIVDDEQAMREQLREYIARFSGENALELEAVTFPSGDALLRDFQPAFDLIIFDIDMPGTNGMDAARRVREMDADVVILFVTNIAQYAINGYEVEAVDYVIKPIGYYDFSLKLRKAVRRAKGRKGDALVLESTGGPIRVETADILYVEVLAHYLIYHTTGGDYRVRGSIREHEMELRGHHFSRIHKSFLVNLARIENICPAEVLVGGQTIPLGRVYKENLMADYLRYLRG